MFTRRQFLFSLPAIAVASRSDISALVQDDPWAKAQKDEKVQQKTVDDALKSDPDASKYIKRFYNVDVVELSEDEKKKSRDKYALVWDKYKLTFSDTAAEKDFKEVLKQQAKEYVKAKNLKQKDAEETSHGYLVAQAIDKVRNATDAIVFLVPELWGRTFPSIGLVAKPFWTEESYKTDGDRRSTLLDFLSQEAKDMFDAVKCNDIWKGTSDKPINTMYLYGAARDSKALYEGVLFSRRYVTQYSKVASGKRKLSDERLKKVATSWETMKQFQAV